MRPVYLLTAVIAAAFATQVGAPQAFGANSEGRHGRDDGAVGTRH